MRYKLPYFPRISHLNLQLEFCIQIRISSYNLLKCDNIHFLDASSHLYNRVCPSVRPSVGPSVGWSVRRSVRPRVTLSSKTRKLIADNVISSSYDHFIIMRTHCWTYGPCSTQIMNLDICSRAQTIRLFKLN